VCVRGGAAKKAGGAQIFIEVRPMDTESTARELPIRSRLGGGMQKAWKPGEGH